MASAMGEIGDTDPSRSTLGEFANMPAAYTPAERWTKLRAETGTYARPGLLFTLAWVLSSAFLLKIGTMVRVYAVVKRKKPAIARATQ